MRPTSTTMRRPPRARRPFLAALALAAGLLPLRMVARNAAASPTAAAATAPPATAPARAPSLLELLPAVRDSVRPTLYLVARDDDCLDRLHLLALLDRPALTGGLARGGVLLLGPDSTALALRRMLAAHRLAHRVRVAPTALASALAHVTRARTPIVLVTAPDGSLRYIAAAPATPDGEDLLARELTMLSHHATPPR